MKSFVLPNKSTVLLLAPYCFSHTHPWHSPGRSRKLDQIEEALRHLGFSIYRLSTAPLRTASEIPGLYPLCSSHNPFVRILQILHSTLCFVSKLFSLPFTRYPALWVYNCRLNEALSVFIILFFLPRIPLFLELEDLPYARPSNSGIRGLLDLVCLQLLTARAKHVFVVSEEVGRSFQRLTPFFASSFSVLPPTLSDTFLSLISERSRPFNAKPINILYAGGYSPEKGVTTLLHAFFRLPLDRFQLTLVGPVPESFSTLKSSHPNLVIAGHVSDFILYSHYCSADVVVSPHEFGPRSSLIFPLKLLEYIASGSFLLTTPMAGLDLFGLPSACFFSSIDELHLKLLNAHSLWLENSKSLNEVSLNVRQSFSRHHMIQLIGSVMMPNI